MRSQDLIVQGLIPQQQGIQQPQQIDTRGQAQYLQRPMMQQIQPPQYNTAQGYPPQVALQNQNQGFTGGNYVPMNMQQSVSRQTNQQYQPNQQFQQYQPNPQFQQYQPNQQFQQYPQYQQYQQNYQQNQTGQVKGLLPSGGNQAPGQQN